MEWDTKEGPHDQTSNYGEKYVLRPGHADDRIQPAIHSFGFGFGRVTLHCHRTRLENIVSCACVLLALLRHSDYMRRCDALEFTLEYGDANAANADMHLG